jgi:hypothetical protein
MSSAMPDASPLIAVNSPARTSPCPPGADFSRMVSPMTTIIRPLISDVAPMIVRTSANQVRPSVTEPNLTAQPSHAGCGQWGFSNEIPMLVAALA